jgi:AAA family ATP:ADP antiporter
MLNTDKLKIFLTQTFDIREGELRRIVLMQSSVFLLITTLLIIKPTINSLFLSEVGIESLPIAFILVALAAGVITTFYSRILNKISLNKTIHYTLVISVISILVFSILLRLNIIDHWILFMFYIWVAVFGVLATSQFWILANIIFNPREAKRLFSLIGGAAIAGGIFGGYLTSALAPLIGSENLLFLGVVFLSICIPLTKKIWYSNPSTASSTFKRKKRSGKVSNHPFRLILQSKHLTYLALITAISVIVSKLVDYQFSAISSLKIDDPDELTAFFGFWYSNINIISLLIQLFITRKVVGVYGVGISLFFMPAGIFIGAIAVLVMPALWSAILIKTSDGGLKQSINKSAIELLALPIASETKNQIKTFIDVFVDSFATGLGGLILILLINGFNLSIQFVSLSIILLILLWFYIAKKVRAEYLSLFKEKLNVNLKSNEKERAPIDINDLPVYEGISKVLDQGTETQILYVLSQVDDLQNEKLLPNIKQLLSHDSPQIVAAAIRKLYFYKSEDLSVEMTKYALSSSQTVKIAAIEYLIERTYKGKMELIQTYLVDESYEIRYAALNALINEVKDNRSLQEVVHLKEVILKMMNELKEHPNDEDLIIKETLLLTAIGNTDFLEVYQYISEKLNSSIPPIKKAAILAAGKTLESKFILPLLSILPEEEFKKTAKEALAEYGFKILPLLKKLIRDNDLDVLIVREVPAIAELIGDNGSVEFLFELLDYEDNMVRNEAIRALSTIKLTKRHIVFNKKRILKHIFEEAVHFENTLVAMYIQQKRMDVKASSGLNEEFEARKSLITILEKRLDDNLERIFRFLGLKYPPEEIDSVLRGIKSDKVEIRINAIEFLDNLLEGNLKKILIPIIETSIMESVNEKTLQDLGLKEMSQYDCFAILMGSKDSKVKLAVLYLIGILKDPKYLPLISPLLHHPNIKLQSLAQQIFADLNT